MSDSEKPFDEFQIEEYKNLSNSHFESVKQVSVFFRYYLLVLAAPVFIFTLIADKDRGLKPFLDNQLADVVYNIVCIYFVTVGIVGFLLLLYVINLRHDAVLYARSVNRVRRYFYETSQLNVEEYDKYLTLPITSSRPRYWELTFFSPLVAVFTLLNSAFVLAGLYLKTLNGKFIFPNWFLPVDVPISSGTIVAALVVFGLLHVIGITILVKKRQNSYLKYFALGIDIDGVLNNQTQWFVEYLKKLTGKNIDTIQIKEIPVNLNPGLGVTDIDEKTVFNTREYWESLAVKGAAVKRINEFQRRFGLRIFFFTYRPWPQYPKESKAEIIEKIEKAGLTPLLDGQLESITAQWLLTNGFIGAWEARAMVERDPLLRALFRIVSFVKGYKQVLFETGNPDITDTRFSNYYRRDILNRNRFQKSQAKGFRFFVEDFPENAIKLSGICDYVFMFDEPYNAPQLHSFPKNIIRVNSWDDIYRWLKKLS